MDLKHGESMPIEIKKGIKTTIQLNVPYRFKIETVGGTIIEGFATINNPISITASNDLKKSDIIIDDINTKSLRLV